MADPGIFRSATLKPAIDKVIAREGAQVVLWNDAVEAVLLRFVESRWLITRHPAVGPDRDRLAARVAWQGVQYAGTGERIAEFADSATLAEWQRQYEDVFLAQQERIRREFVAAIGNEPHPA